MTISFDLKKKKKFFFLLKTRKNKLLQKIIKKVKMNKSKISKLLFILVSFYISKPISINLFS